MKKLFLILAFVAALANGSDRWNKNPDDVTPHGEILLFIDFECVERERKLLINRLERKGDLVNLACIGNEAARAAIGRLVDGRADVLNMPNEEGLLPLHSGLWDASSSSLRTTELLLELGANPNIVSSHPLVSAPSGHHGTALHVLVRGCRFQHDVMSIYSSKSAKRDSLSCLKKSWDLLRNKYRADPLIKDTEGKTAQELYDELVTDLRGHEEKS